MTNGMESKFKLDDNQPRADAKHIPISNFLKLLDINRY